MCKFFSLVSDGNGIPYYFDWTLRDKIIKKELPYESADSHTSIADYFYKYGGLKSIPVNEARERIDDRVNKYEYNPITKFFEVDGLNVKDDSREIKQFCDKLDFKSIVPHLNVNQKIVHTFSDIAPSIKITAKDIQLLKQWASVRASVSHSVRASVSDSVSHSVSHSVWASVCDSVSYSVGDSVSHSVSHSVWASVWDSVWDSVWASVWAYTSSWFTLNKWLYFNHKKGVNPFQSCIDLWHKGLVPSFDGNTWRLHTGKDAHVVFEITQEELKNIK